MVRCLSYLQLNHSDAYPIPVLYKVFCSLLRVLQRNKNKKILMNKKTPKEFLISQGMRMSEQTRRQPQWTEPVRVASAFPGNLLECSGPTQIHWVIDWVGPRHLVLTSPPSDSDTSSDKSPGVGGTSACCRQAEQRGRHTSEWDQKGPAEGAPQELGLGGLLQASEML